MNNKEHLQFKKRVNNPLYYEPDKTERTNYIFPGNNIYKMILKPSKRQMFRMRKELSNLTQQNNERKKSNTNWDGIKCGICSVLEVVPNTGSIY